MSKCLNFAALLATRHSVHHHIHRLMDFFDNQGRCRALIWLSLWTSVTRCKKLTSYIVKWRERTQQSIYTTLPQDGDHSSSLSNEKRLSAYNVTTVRPNVFASSKSTESLFEDEYSQRIASGHDDIDSQVKLEPVNQERLTVKTKGIG